MAFEYDLDSLLGSVDPDLAQVPFDAALDRLARKNLAPARPIVTAAASAPPRYVVPPTIEADTQEAVPMPRARPKSAPARDWGMGDDLIGEAPEFGKGDELVGPAPTAEMPPVQDLDTAKSPVKPMPPVQGLDLPAPPPPPVVLQPTGPMPPVQEMEGAPFRAPGSGMATNMLTGDEAFQARKDSIAGAETSVAEAQQRLDAAMERKNAIGSATQRRGTPGQQQRLSIEDEVDRARANLESAKRGLAAAERSAPPTQTATRDAASRFATAIGQAVPDTVGGIMRPVDAALDAVGVKGGTGTAEWMRKQSERIGRANQPDLTRDEELAAKLGQGGGSAVGFVATGIVGKAAGLPAWAASGVAGAAQNAEQYYREADDMGLPAYKKAMAYITGGAIGSTEAIGLGRIADSMDKATGGGVKRYFGMIAKEMGEEGLQEGGQQLLDNIAKYGLFGKDPGDITKDVATNALVGAMLGMGMAGTLGAPGLIGGRKAAEVGVPVPDTSTANQEELIRQILAVSAQPPAPPAAVPPPPAAPPIIEATPAASPQAAPEQPEQPAPPQPAPSAEAPQEAPKPTVTDEERGTLRAYGYEDAQIDAMSPRQRAAEMADAREAGVTPEPLRRTVDEEADAFARKAGFANSDEIGPDTYEPIYGEHNREFNDRNLSSGETPIMEKTEASQADFGAGDVEIGTRSAVVPLETAEDVKAATQPAQLEYTPAQGEANNRPLGHAKWNGLDLSIETPAGGVRKGVDKKTGQPWETTMGAAYGYIRGTVGADDMHVDVFVGENPENQTVYVINENDRETGKYRQSKAMIGFPSQQAAVAAYTGTSSKSAADIGGVAAVDVAEFKDWLKTGNTKKAFPIAKAEAPRAPAPRRVNNEPTSLLQMIAYRGGLKPDAELKAMGLGSKNRVMVPGVGWRSVLRGKGGTMDQLAEWMVEDGFLPPESELRPGDTGLHNQIRDMIDQELRGQSALRMTDDPGLTKAAAARIDDENAQRDAVLADNRAEIDALVQEYGLPTNEQDVRRAAEIMADEGLSADEALEQAAMRAVEEEMVDGREENDDIYGFDALDEVVQDGGNARSDPDARIQGLGGNESSLLKPQQQSVRSLRGEGDNDLPGLAGELYDLPSGYGTEAKPKSLDRSRERGQGIRPGQLSMGDDRSADAESTELQSGADAQRQNANDRGMGGRAKDVSTNAVHSMGEGLASRPTTDGESVGVKRSGENLDLRGQVDERDRLGQTDGDAKERPRETNKLRLVGGAGFDDARPTKSKVAGNEIHPDTAHEDGPEAERGSERAEGAERAEAEAVVEPVSRAGEDGQRQGETAEGERADVAAPGRGAGSEREAAETDARAADAQDAADAETAEEVGADNKPQLVLPGAEKAPDAKLAQIKADAPLKPKKVQEPADEGLFGDGHKQTDLLDMARQPAKPAKSDNKVRQTPTAPDPLDLAMAGELTAERARQIAGDLTKQQKSVESEIFGDRADEWRKLNRQSNRAWDNADDAKAKAIDAKIAEIEKEVGLTAADENWLNGQGWQPHSVPDYWQDIARNLQDIENGREDAVAVAASEVRHLPKTNDWSKMYSSDRSAVITILSAMNAEQAAGRDPKAFLRDVFAERIRRYGGGPDAHEVAQYQMEELANLLKSPLRREGQVDLASKPKASTYDQLFNAIETRETDNGVEMFTLRQQGVPASAGNVISEGRSDNTIKVHPDYSAAKSGSVESAARLVQDTVSDRSIAAASDRFGPDALYAPVIALEQSGHNQIPTALAGYYAAMTGARLSTSVVQSNQAFHTGANAMERLSTRAEFEGAVEPGARYVLVDDVTVMGSTLADFAHHIQSNGGTVIGVVTLANAGRSGILTAPKAAISHILRRFGDAIKDTFGIEPASLTADEAAYIRNFKDVDALRNRVAAAERQRRERLLSKGISEAESQDTGIKTSEENGTSRGAVSDSDDTLSLRHKLSSTPMARARRAAMEEQLTAIIERIVGRRVSISFEDVIPINDAIGWGKLGEDVQTAAGSYAIARRLIRLAMADPRAAGNERTTAYHEAFHAMEHLIWQERGPERDVLLRERDRLENWILKNMNLGLNETKETLAGLAGYEIRAIAFEGYAMMREAGRPINGLHIAIRRGFEKLMEIMRRIRNYLEGFGYRTAEDVFSDVYEGKVRERADAAERSTFAGAAEMADRGEQFSVRRARPRSGNLPTPGFQVPAETVREAMADPNMSRRERLSAAIDALMMVPSRALWDRLIDLSRFQRAAELASGQPTAQNLDTYLAASIYPGRVGERLKDIEKLVKPIVQALKERNISRAELHEYLYARHAGERNAQIRTIDPNNDAGSGMTDQEAQDILNQAAPRQADFDAVAALVDNMVRFNRDLMDTEGLEDSETLLKWATVYRNYVPLKGAENQESDQLDPKTGKGFTTRGPESRRALGRFGRADDILTNLLEQTQRTIIRAEKARVGKTFLRWVQRNPTPLIKHGLAETERRPNKTTGLVETVWITTSADARDTFAVKVAGETHYLRIEHEGLLLALKSLDMDRLPPFFAMISRFTRQFAAFQTARNPEFVFSNLSRDLQDAGFNLNAETKKGFQRAFWKHVFNGKALMSAVLGQLDKTDNRYGRLYEEWRQAGGKISTFGYKDLETIRRELEATLDRSTESMTRKVISQPGRLVNPYTGHIVKTFEAISDVAESMTRLAVYAAAREVGMTQALAAKAARSTTVDFQGGGKYAQWIAMGYAFAKPAMLGSINLIRRLRRSPKMRAAAGGVAMFGFALTLWNLAAGDDEDDQGKKINRYADLKYHEREKNIIIFWPGKKEPTKLSLGGKLPLGYALAPFFMMGENAAMAIQGKKKPTEAFYDWLGTAAKTFNPLGGEGSIFAWHWWAGAATPTIGDPIIELTRNRNWLNRPIHPDEMPWTKGKPHSEQSKVLTNPLAISAAETFNRWSGGNHFKKGAVDLYPDDIEYAWNFALGGYGKFMANSYGMTADAIAGVDTPPERIPFVRRFVVPAQSAVRDTEKYYDALTESTERSRAVRDALKALKAGTYTEDAQATIEELGPKIGLGVGKRGGVKIDSETTFREANKELSALRQQERAARTNSNLDRAKRADIIKELRERQTAIMKAARRSYENISSPPQ